MCDHISKGIRKTVWKYLESKEGDAWLQGITAAVSPKLTEPQQNEIVQWFNTHIH